MYPTQTHPALASHRRERFRKIFVSVNTSQTDDSDDSSGTKSFETGWRDQPYCWQASSDLWKQGFGSQSAQLYAKPPRCHVYGRIGELLRLLLLCDVGVGAGCSNEFAASIKTAPSLGECFDFPEECGCLLRYVSSLPAAAGF